jgi:hypothetical protein
MKPVSRNSPAPHAGNAERRIGDREHYGPAAIVAREHRDRRVDGIVRGELLHRRQGRQLRSGSAGLRCPVGCALLANAVQKHVVDHLVEIDRICL